MEGGVTFHQTPIISFDDVLQPFGVVVFTGTADALDPAMRKYNIIYNLVMLLKKKKKSLSPRGLQAMYVI